VLNNENVTSGGRHIICSQILRKHETMKSVLNYLATIPFQSKEKVSDAPLILICGLPRTGTTLLNNLLTCDVNCRALLISDMSMESIPSILRSNVDEHKQRMEIEGASLMQIFQTAGCDFQLYLKNVSSSHPLFPIEEDVVMLGAMDLDVIYCNTAPKQANLVKYLTNRHNKDFLYQSHQTVLQMLHAADSPRKH
jgi:hypothetical protein